MLFASCASHLYRHGERFACSTAAHELSDRHATSWLLYCFSVRYFTILFHSDKMTQMTNKSTANAVAKFPRNQFSYLLSNCFVFKTSALLTE